MDPVGLSVGVVSMVGLITTCIQFFQILRSNEVFDRDTQILFRKLDIERELLMQWAHECGLLRRQHIDGTLFGPRTDPVVYGTLEEISILLAEAASLQRKYLPAAAVSWREPTTATATGGGGRGEKAKAKYAADGSKIGLRRKLMFTIDDKSEFEHLLSKLEYFVAKLPQLVPSVEHRRAMREDLRLMGCDARTIRLRLSDGSRGGPKHRYREGDEDECGSRVERKSRGDVVVVQHSLNDSCSKDKRLQQLCEEKPRWCQQQRQPPPSYSQSELSYRGVHASHERSGGGAGPRSSARSVASSQSSRLSSRETAREMVGDLLGGYGRGYSRRTSRNSR